MFLKLLPVILLNSLCCSAFSQNKEVEPLKQVVYALANDSMQGRNAGTIGERKAGKYLLACYKKIGLTPLHGSYIQKFAFPKDSTHIDTATNVIGMINNKADSTIIIGAHYDHIGFGGPKSRSLVGNKIHPGADDNASGVAMMLTIAEHLKKSGSKKFNYMFIAFSAEEEGLYGSKAFVANTKCDWSKVKLMINLVMVGRLDTRSAMLRLMRSNMDNRYDSVLAKLTGNNFKLRITDENISYTDASAFMKNRILALSFTTGIHDDYHKTSDTADKINYDGMATITRYLEDFIDKVCGKS